MKISPYSFLLVFLYSKSALSAPVAETEAMLGSQATVSLSVESSTTITTAFPTLTSIDSVDGSPISTSDISNDLVAGWDFDFEGNYFVNGTCSSDNGRLVVSALAQAVNVAEHARKHLLRYRNSSDAFKRYFGTSPAACPLGVYDLISNGDNSDISFTCEDLDNKCNSTSSGFYFHNETETVICPAALGDRISNYNICSSGFTIAQYSAARTWAGQFLIQILDTPTIGAGLEERANSYREATNLAKVDPEKATKNKMSLIYFALDVWAFDIANPGIGCTGNIFSPYSGTFSRHYTDFTATATYIGGAGIPNIVVTKTITASGSLAAAFLSKAMAIQSYTNSGSYQTATMITLTRDNTGDALSSINSQSLDRVVTVTSTIPSSSLAHSVVTVTSTIPSSSSKPSIFTETSTIPSSKQESSRSVVTVTSTIPSSSPKPTIISVTSTIQPSSHSVVTVTSTIPSSSSSMSVVTITSATPSSSSSLSVVTVTSTIPPSKSQESMSVVTITSIIPSSSPKPSITTVISTIPSSSPTYSVVTVTSTIPSARSILSVVTVTSTISSSKPEETMSVVTVTSTIPSSLPSA